VTQLRCGGLLNNLVIKILPEAYLAWGSRLLNNNKKAQLTQGLRAAAPPPSESLK